MDSATKELLEELIASTQRPDEWDVDVYHAQHKPTGCKFWMANGYLCFEMQKPTSINFGMLGSWRLWRAICRLRALKILVKGEEACKR